MRNLGRHPGHSRRIRSGLNIVAPACLILSWFVIHGVFASGVPQIDGAVARSQEVRELAALVFHGLETFQPKPLLQSLTRQMIALDPDSALGHYLMSEVQDSPEKSRGFLRHAYVLSLAENPDLDSRFFKAQYLKDPQPDIAIRTLEALLKERPDLRPAWMTLGRLYLDQGRIHPAEEALGEALQLDDGTARVHALLAECAFLRGDFQGSRGLYEKALMLKNPQAAPYDLYTGIALTHLSENRTEEAIAVLERSLVGGYRGTRPTASDLIFRLSRQPLSPRRTLFNSNGFRDLLRNIRLPR